MLQTDLNEKSRISSIDIMRGIVMVIMALDHVRDYFHADASIFNPTDLTQTNPILFFTRWITHFCAPTFIFLSGVSARIGLQRKSKNELAWLLFTRGIWLIVLEQTIFRFGFTFSFYYDMVFFLVLWSIGGSMIILAGLVYLSLSPRVVLIIGLIIIFGHHAFDGIRLTPGEPGYAVWTFIMQSGFVPPGTVVPYSLIPWLGLLLVGYGTGTLYTEDVDPYHRRKMLFNIGLAATILFVVIRAINVYGDLAPWSVQKNTLFTIMSFINTTKYPVSLQFSLMILGPVLMMLSWLENSRNKALETVSVFGRVPLFYYIGHFYLIHAVALILFMINTGTSWSQLDFSFSKGLGGIPSGFGYTLIWTHVAWIGTVLIMYPLCRWYNNYKSSHKWWWLSYL